MGSGHMLDIQTHITMGITYSCVIRTTDYIMNIANRKQIDNALSANNSFICF